MTGTEPPLVFISYNVADRDLASNVAMFVAAENIATWYDEWRVSAGDSIIDKVEDGLRGCSHFVILWSQNANKSDWVRAELKSTLTRALKNKSPKIIPVIIDNTPLPSLLLDLRYIRYKGGTEHDRQELIEGILGKKPTMNFIRSVVRKYHEIVYDHTSDDPFGVKVCPYCGSDKFARSSITDYSSDEDYYILKCEECGWSTATQ